MKNFIQNMSHYKLWHIWLSDLPQVAIEAIEEWYESQALYILAWFSSWQNSFEIEDYFNKSLIELNIILPTLKESFNIILSYYLKWIDKAEIDFEEGMRFIYYDLILPFCSTIWEDQEHSYSWCWLSILWWTYVYYTDVDEDLEWGLFYKKWVTAEELKEHYKKMLYEEIKSCIDKLDKWILN